VAEEKALVIIAEELKQADYRADHPERVASAYCGGLVVRKRKPYVSLARALVACRRFSGTRLLDQARDGWLGGL